MERGLLQSVMLLATLAVAMPTAEPEPPRVVRASIEWLDVWVPGNNTKGVPKVLLVGDSITRAYFKDVDDRLKG